MDRRSFLKAGAVAPLAATTPEGEPDFVETSTTPDWNEIKPGVRVAWFLHDHLEERGEMLLMCWIAPGSGRKHPFWPDSDHATIFYLTRVIDRAHAGRVQRRWPDGLPGYASWCPAYEPNGRGGLNIPLAPDFS